MTNSITLKMIDGECAVFTTSRGKLQAHAHKIGMMIVNHSAPKEAGPDACGTGNCDRALKLTLIMPNSWANQMEEWFKVFTPIRVVTGNGKVGYDPKYKAIKDNKKLSDDEKTIERLKWWKLSDAEQTPYHEVKQEERPKPDLTFEAILKGPPALAKRLEKQIEDELVPASLMPTVLATIAMYKSMKIVRVSTKSPENDDTLGNASPEDIAA